MTASAAAWHVQHDQVLPCPTDADFSSSAYRVVTCTGTDTDVAANGSAPVTGFLTANIKDFSSDTSAKADVVTSGTCIGVAGAAIAMNALVMPTTGGKVITATDGNYACGRALSTPAADGDHVLIKIGVSYLETT